MNTPAEVSADDELLAGTIVGEYEIESLLGAGGMGEVYRALHPVIGKRVAIKVMNRYCSANPANVERFVQEAKAVNAIGHANIVDIFSFGKMTDGRCYFVMEWLQGRSLRDEIDRATIAPARALDILEAVLRALEASHAAGIVHRDLKPDNIFLVQPRDGEPERVKLLDFGIAKLADDGTQVRNNRTKTGTVIGTPSYMAPEQASGVAITPQADVYSLGVVAFEMFTGRTPFEGESAVQIMAKHVDHEPPRPSTIRPVMSGVEALVMAMLAKPPTARPTPSAARERVARLRADPGEVLDHRVPAATSPLHVSLRSSALGAMATTPLTVEPRPRVARAASPAVGTVAVPARSRPGWLVVALLGGLGVAAIAIGIGTTRHPTPTTAPTPTPTSPAPTPAPTPTAAVAPPPTPTPTPVAVTPTAIAPAGAPAKPAGKPAAPVKPVRPVTPSGPPAAATPAKGSAAPPVRPHDVDSVYDPYAAPAAAGSGGSP